MFGELVLTTSKRVVGLLTVVRFDYRKACWGLVELR